jgi:hypothetical protein
LGGNVGRPAEAPPERPTRRRFDAQGAAALPDGETPAFVPVAARGPLLDATVMQPERKTTGFAGTNREDESR